MSTHTHKKCAADQFDLLDLLELSHHCACAVVTVMHILLLNLIYVQILHVTKDFNHLVVSWLSSLCLCLCLCRWLADTATQRTDFQPISESITHKVCHKTHFLIYENETKRNEMNGSSNSSVKTLNANAIGTLFSHSNDIVVGFSKCPSMVSICKARNNIYSD